MESEVIFTPEECAAYVRFMKKVRQNGYFFPDGTMEETHATISFWAPELVITAGAGPGRMVLLAKYDGGAKAFQGMWHIPGGYNRWQEANIQTTCNRVAEREIGTTVDYRSTLDSYKWQTGEHPYGHPLSLYVLCVPDQPIQTSEKLNWFHRFSLPENMVVPHRNFLASWL